MKKLTITLLGLMLFMIVPSMANAATSMSVSISCKDVTINKTATCTVTGKAFGGSISGVEGNYSISGGASINSFAVGSGWLGEGSGGSFSIYTDTNKANSFTIGTFTVKGNKIGQVTISLTNVLGFDADFKDVKVSNVSRTFNVIEATTTSTTTKNPNVITQPTTSSTTSSSTTSTAPLVLNTIKVDDFYVSYENGVYYATVNSETEKVTISATAGAGITIVGTGQRNLAVGKNAVDLILRNPGGQTVTYQLIITRPEGMTIMDTKLTKLKVVGYDFAFSPDTKEYTVSVPSSIKEVYIHAESYSDNVIITGAGLQTLNKGTTDVYIRVSYGDLASTEYKITIKRNYIAVFMWIIIGTLGTALVAMGIYANINRKAAVAKVIAEKNKQIAQNNRNEMVNSAPQVQLNGESVVGTGKKTVAPTPVMNVQVAPTTPPVAQVTPTVSQAPSTTLTPVAPTVVAGIPSEKVEVSDPEMIKTAPPAQVKVVKTTVVPVQQPIQTQTVRADGPSQPTIVKVSDNKPIV